MKLRLNEGSPILRDLALPSIEKISDLASAVETIATRMAEEAVRASIDRSIIFVADEDGLMALMCIRFDLSGDDLYIDVDIRELLKEYALQSKDHAEYVSGELKSLSDEILGATSAGQLV